MKRLSLFACVLLSLTAYSQDGSTNYSMSPKDYKKEFFISTNSGILKTPVGFKVGFIANPGVYVGFRHGIGKVFNADSDQNTNATNLYSITAGINKPMIIRNDFKLIAQLGVGYGEWWDFRWERWAKSGYELECGLMFEKKNFLISISGNMLDASRRYPTGDLCIGIGYTLNNCD